MKVRILNYNYYNILSNKYDPDFIGPVLVICGRDKQGNFKRIRCLDEKFTPHFFVEDTQENRRKAKELGLNFENVDYNPVYDEDEKIIKIKTTFPYEVAKYRDYFDHTYNADIKWAQLAMMTLQLPGGFIDVPDKDWVTFDEIKPVPRDEEFYIKPRIFYFDIETRKFNPNKDFSDTDNAEIISIVLYDNYENTYHTMEWSEKNKDYFIEKKTITREIKKKEVPKTSQEIIYHFSSEKSLLKRFFQLFNKQPDAICGFNSHGGYRLQSYGSSTKREWRNGYDEVVIYKRAIKNGLRKDMQKMSPLPVMKNIYGKYYGVYQRGRGDKFEVVIRGVTPMDIYWQVPKMGYIRKYHDFFGRGLDDYLNYFAGIGKVEHQGLSVSELKEIDLYEELRYNRRDVEGLIFLDNYFGYHKDVFDRVALFQVQGIDLLVSTKLHSFLTRKYSQGKCVYDTGWQDWERNMWQGWLEKKKHKYGITTKKYNRAGGYNVDVEKGACGWTAVIDFSRLYPNLLMSANVGIDTLVQVKEEYEDYYLDFKNRKIYKKDCNITPSAPFLKKKIKEAIDVQIWKMLIDYRNELKNKMKPFLESGNVDSKEFKMIESKEYNLKQGALNNKYGVMGNPGNIVYNLALYNAAPSMAQPLIRGLSEEFLPSIGYHARMGDTDSVAPNLKSDNINDAIKEIEWLVKQANEYCRKKVKELYNLDTDKVLLDWEKIGPYFYGHEKKNYLLEVWAQDGEILPKDKRYIMYKGFELKKRNRADITETVQKAYFKICRNVMMKDLDYSEEMFSFIKRINKIFPLLPWETICSRINIKRDLDTYAKNYFSRRAADFSNERFGTNFGANSHGFLGYVDMPANGDLEPIMMFNKEHIPEIKEYGYDLDYETHKEKFVKDKLNYLFRDYGLDWYNIVYSKKISDVMVI